MDFDRHYDEDGVIISHSTEDGGWFNSYDTEYRAFPSQLPSESHADSYCRVIDITTSEKYSIIELEFEVNVFRGYTKWSPFPKETLRLERGYVRLIIPNKSNYKSIVDRLKNRYSPTYYYQNFQIKSCRTIL